MGMKETVRIDLAGHEMTELFEALTEWVRGK